MQVNIHPSSFVLGQPITPVSWPRKLPRPSHISVNTSRRPASADSTCTVSSTSSLPPSPSSISPSSYTSSLPSPHSSRSESEVHRAVSRLLSLTKQLQEVITLWANGSADEAQVSDAFVLVGSQFDSTVHAFWHVGIDMSDLYDVPTSLRTVLEGLLAEDPSPAVLARYSPRIRKIIVELLQGLQRKQMPYWSAIGRTKDNGYLSPVPATSMRDR